MVELPCTVDLLRQRQVERGAWSRDDIISRHVGRHAYDAHLDVPDREPLAEGVAVRPELLGHGPVDDDDRWSVYVVLLGEPTTGAQGDAHRTEVIRNVLPWRPGC